MGNFKEKTEIGDAPVLYKEEMQIPANIPPIKRPNCSSMNTVCLYSQGGGSIIGAYKDQEYLCKDFKKYIVYSYDYDS